MGSLNVSFLPRESNETRARAQARQPRDLPLHAQSEDLWPLRNRWATDDGSHTPSPVRSPVGPASGVQATRRPGIHIYHTHTHRADSAPLAGWLLKCLQVGSGPSTEEINNWYRAPLGPSRRVLKWSHHRHRMHANASIRTPKANHLVCRSSKQITEHVRVIAVIRVAGDTLLVA